MKHISNSYSLLRSFGLTYLKIISSYAHYHFFFKTCLCYGEDIDSYVARVFAFKCDMLPPFLLFDSLLLPFAFCWVIAWIFYRVTRCHHWDLLSLMGLLCKQYPSFPYFDLLIASSHRWWEIQVVIKRWSFKSFASSIALTIREVHNDCKGTINRR